MKTFEEILAQAPPRRLIFAPFPATSLLPASLETALRDRGHTLTFLEEENPDRTVKEACRLLAGKEADILVQGDIPLQLFLSILEAEQCLDKNPCFVSLFEDRLRRKLLLVADTYCQDNPGLEEKTACLQQVIALAGRLGLDMPKTAVLSAIETINPAIPSTVDAAVLSKMSQRGQFDALVEGPLSIDALVDSTAARIKGVQSPVPGNFDIILCPDVETGYALSQAFTCIGGFPTAGILLGTRCPVVINPRFIPPEHKAVEVAVHALQGGGRGG